MHLSLGYHPPFRRRSWWSAPVALFPTAVNAASLLAACVSQLSCVWPGKDTQGQLVTSVNLPVNTAPNLSVEARRITATRRTTAGFCPVKVS